MPDLRLRAIAPYAGLVALALSLRWYGLDWGNYHPDEWPIESFARGLGLPNSLGEFFSPESPLNPGWFNYGSLPLILLAPIGWIGDRLREIADFVPQRHVLWRGATGVADAITVILVARIGREVYGQTVGFLAAAFYALAVLPIQLSHYFTVDPLMTALLMGSALASVRFLRSRNEHTGYLAAFLIGLAISTKATAIVFSMPVAFAWIAYLWAVTREGGNADTVRNALSQAILAGLIAIAAFAIAQPYAIIDWPTYTNDVLTQANMARGELELPFTIQYIDTTPWLYHIRNMVVWGLGIPLGVAAIAGVSLITWRAARRRNIVELLIIASLLIPFLWIGSQQVKFMRYLLPLYPLFCIAAALAVISGMALLARFGRRGTWAGMTLAGVVIIPTAFYALAFTTVFGGTHPVDRMSVWITDNVPPGSVITTETWDQRFHGEHRYDIESIEVYWADDRFKAEMISDQLSRADYVYMFSNRGYGSVSRLPDRFPVMRAYYETLFDGSLGFELARVEATYPSLLGVTFVDDSIRYLDFEPSSPDVIDGGATGPVINLGPADESFTVYERPKPMLFRKVSQLSEPKLLQLLTADLFARRGTTLYQRESPSLLMSPELAAAQDEGGTWTEIMSVTGRGSGTEFVLWLLAIQGIALAGFPLMARIFRPLPDSGYLLGKALSLLIVSYLAWLGASLQVIAFSRESVLAAILILALASAFVTYRSRREIVTLIRLRWRWLLSAEVLFIAVFLVLVVLRAANPDLWHPFRGGEKPMDVSYLTAVTRSSFMPPYDPWFAGGHLNYYYFGHFIVATLIRLTGTVPEFAVNLAIPTFWTMTFCAAFSIGVNLTEATIQRIRARQFPAPGSLAVGLLAALMVAIAGNLDGLIQLSQQLGPELWKTLTEPGAGGVSELMTFAVPVLTGDGFDFWRSSRMVAVPGTFSITEFPFFSYLFADPHAHIFAMPFALVTVGLSLAVALALRDRRRFLSVALPFAALALTLGALFAAHSWDYPTYLFMAVAAITIALLARSTGIKKSMLYGTTAAIVLVVASFLLFAPYHAANATFYTEIVPSNEQTPIRSLVAIFGLPLLIVIASLRPALALSLGLPDAGIRAMWRETRYHLWPSEDTGIALLRRMVTVVGGGIVLSGVVALFIVGQGNLAITGALAIVTLALALSNRLPLTVRLAFGAASLAFGLIAAVDVFAIQDHLVRMNTIFRVYLQAWILLGISAAFLLWWMVRRGGALRIPGVGRIYRFAFYGAAAIAILGVSIYPVLGTRARLADRIDANIPLTLDGTAYMQEGTYRDVGDTEIILRLELDALLWLRENAEGIPVVAEAGLPPTQHDTPYYRIQSRAAMYAGQTMIVGWPWHQRQQRGIGIAEPEIDRRQLDVSSLYSSGSPSVITRILDEYDVGYVLVGQTERAYYPETDVQTLERHPRLSLAYENEAVRIYKVAQG